MFVVEGNQVEMKVCLHRKHLSPRDQTFILRQRDKRASCFKGMTRRARRDFDKTFFNAIRKHFRRPNLWRGMNAQCVEGGDEGKKAGNVFRNESKSRERHGSGFGDCGKHGWLIARKREHT